MKSFLIVLGIGMVSSMVPFGYLGLIFGCVSVVLNTLAFCFCLYKGWLE